MQRKKNYKKYKETGKVQFHNIQGTIEIKEERGSSDLSRIKFWCTNNVQFPKRRIDGSQLIGKVGFK